MGNSSGSERRKYSQYSPEHDKDLKQTIKRNNMAQKEFTDETPIHSGWGEVSGRLQSRACQKNDLEIKLDNLQCERRDLLSELEGKKEEIMSLKMEVDYLRTRLRKLASDRLTDNNPNITDLSDDNRAIKVGEKFIELYNNEWSDAFEELTEVEEMKEEEAIKYLFHTIKEIFDKCKKTAQEHSNKLEEAILEFTGNEEIHPMLAISLKVYKDERKRRFRNTVPSTKTIIRAIAPSKERILGKLNTYVEAATIICWLMCIQDPPMVLKTTKKGKKFDGKYFCAYTERGNRVAFPVWPALLLCNDGPVVQKGIAQGKIKDKRILASISPPATNNKEKTHTWEPENNTLTTLDTDYQESGTDTLTRVLSKEFQELDKNTLTKVAINDFPGNNSTVN